MPTTISRARVNSIVFELYAVHLFLCSPHPLSRAWTDAKDADVKAASKAALAKLSLSEDARTVALELMVALTRHRGFFKGIADTLKFSDLYAGNEPHPPEGHDEEIIKAMQGIDTKRRKR